MIRASAPGRVNLIGEHTDYNDGLVLPLTIADCISIELTARNDSRVQVASDGYPGVAYRVGDERKQGDWGDYIRGATWALGRAGYRFHGFDAKVSTMLRPGAGLGSSAALLVATSRAMREAFALRLDDMELALLAHRAESEFVGARVGVMDQIASSLGSPNEALLIDTRSLRIDRVPIPATVAVVCIDSGTSHAHATGEYNQRRTECEDAAQVMGLRSLRDATLDDVGRVAAGNPLLAQRARHVVTENERVRRFVESLQRGHLDDCGAELDSSHRSLRDDFEVSVPEIDALVEVLRNQRGAYGARLVGGGFGGSVLGLMDRDRALDAANAAANTYRNTFHRDATVARYY